MYCREIRINNGTARKPTAIALATTGTYSSALKNALVFHSKRGSPLRETSVLTEILHPVLRALRLPQAGMHAFRHGCTRWELSGMNPAVLRQQMGHRSATMTARYTGEIPLDQVQVALSKGKLEIWKMAALYVQSLSRV